MYSTQNTPKQTSKFTQPSRPIRNVLSYHETGAAAATVAEAILMRVESCAHGFAFELFAAIGTLDGILR